MARTMPLKAARPKGWVLFILKRASSLSGCLFWLGIIDFSSVNCDLVIKSFPSWTFGLGQLWGGIPLPVAKPAPTLAMSTCSRALQAHFWCHFWTCGCLACGWWRTEKTLLSAASSRAGSDSFNLWLMEEGRFMSLAEPFHVSMTRAGHGSWFALCCSLEGFPVLWESEKPMWTLTHGSYKKAAHALSFYIFLSDQSVCLSGPHFWSRIPVTSCWPLRDLRVSHAVSSTWNSLC